MMSAIARPRGTMLYWLTLGIVALAPLPLGSNRPWAWSLLAVLVGALLVIWSLDHLRSPRRFAVSPGRIAASAWLFGAACLYVVVQTLPVLPVSIAHPLWSLNTAIGPSEGLVTISISPNETRAALLRLLSYAVVFWLVLQGSRGSRRADEAIATIGIVSGLYSAYGVAVILTGSEAILWFEKWAYQDSATGTFVNRNSFATYAGLGLLCAAAYLFRSVIRADFDRSGFRRFVGSLLGGMTPLMMGTIAAVPLTLAALFLTQSRAGIIFSLLALLVFLGGLGFRLRTRRRTLIYFAAPLIAATIYYFLLSGGGFVERLDSLVGSDISKNARLLVYQATISSIAESPWLGIGYGTYEDFFRTIRSPEIPGRFTKAHNIYLENALELGLPMVGALIISIGLLALRALRGIRRRRSTFVYGWMAFCASLLVGGHALVDFSLQIPAIAVTFAAILAVGCSQSWSSRIDTSR